MICSVIYFGADKLSDTIWLDPWKDPNKKGNDMKLIFLDADGTLFHHEGYIPASAKKAIQLAQQNGHKIILSTGRQLKEIYGELASIDYDGIIAGAGATVTARNQLLFESSLSQEQIQQLKTYMDTYQIPCMYECANAVYADKKTFEAVENLMSLWCQGLSEEEKKNHGLYLVYSHLSPSEEVDLLDLPINKVSFLQTERSFAQIKDDLEKDFDVIQATFLPFGKESGEIAAYGIDKATGMQVLKAYYEGDQMIALGDGQNDLGMFEKADLAIAMGNADDSIKTKADHVTTRLEDDGIYKAFKTFGLI